MDWLFADWPTLGHTLVVAGGMYLGTILVIRLAGKRTMSKWNAFDSVVTVAMGSSLATTVLSGQTSLAQGLLAFGVLVSLQLLLSWTVLRVPLVERLVKSDPSLLVLDGKICHAELRRERVAESELRAAVRRSGIARLEDVAAVVLETDGSISVLPQSGRPPEREWALQGLLTDAAGVPSGKSR